MRQLQVQEGGARFRSTALAGVVQVALRFEVFPVKLPVPERHQQFDYRLLTSPPTTSITPSRPLPIAKQVASL